MRNHRKHSRGRKNQNEQKEVKQLEDKTKNPKHNNIRSVVRFVDDATRENFPGDLSYSAYKEFVESIGEEKNNWEVRAKILIICENCEKDVSSDFKYCPHCGIRFLRDFDNLA